MLGAHNPWTRAASFAGKAHDGQTIPGSGVPYIKHPAAVVEEIRKAGLSPDDNILAVTVAWLHDTIEDTGVAYEELARIFGKSVADGVLALSKNPELPKEIRMQDSLERIKVQPKPIWMVKLADRIVNMQKPPITWKPKKIVAYKAEAVVILDQLGSANPVMRDLLRTRIEMYPYGEANGQ